MFFKPRILTQRRTTTTNSITCPPKSSRLFQRSKAFSIIHWIQNIHSSWATKHRSLWMERTPRWTTAHSLVFLYPRFCLQNKSVPRAEDHWRDQRKVTCNLARELSGIVTETFAHTIRPEPSTLVQARPGKLDFRHDLPLIGAESPREIHVNKVLKHSTGAALLPRLR